MGIEWELISFNLAFSIPWPASWGELPALYMILGGFTLIFSEVQILSTCDFSTHRWRKSQPSWLLLLACFVCVFLWPWAAYIITKTWRGNVRLNKYRSPEWESEDDDL